MLNSRNFVCNFSTTSLKPVCSRFTAPEQILFLGNRYLCLICNGLEVAKPDKAFVHIINMFDLAPSFSTLLPGQCRVDDASLDFLKFLTLPEMA